MPCGSVAVRRAEQVNPQTGSGWVIGGRDGISLGTNENILDLESVAAARLCDCTARHCIVHFRMVKTVNFALCYHTHTHTPPAKRF